MNPLTEGNMPIGLTQNVKLVGLVKYVRVAVGSTKYGVDSVTFSNNLAAYVNIFSRPAWQSHVGWSLETQHFLDCGTNDERVIQIRSQQLTLSRVLHQREYTVADEIRNRFIPGSKQQKDHCQQFLSGKSVACIFGQDESIEQIVGGT